MVARRGSPADALLNGQHVPTMESWASILRWRQWSPSSLNPPLIPLDDAGMPASVVYYSDDVAFHELLYRVRRSSGPSITFDG